MGYLVGMYGKMDHQFIRGAIASVFEYCPVLQQSDAVREIIS